LLAGISGKAYGLEGLNSFMASKGWCGAADQEAPKILMLFPFHPHPFSHKKSPRSQGRGLGRASAYALFASASSCSVQIRLPMVQLVLQADWQEV